MSFDFFLYLKYRYAKHLTKEQAEQLSAPHPDSIRIVNEWLISHGIDPTDNSARRSKAGDWVIVTVAVGQAERVLGTKYHTYKHSKSGEEIVRTLSYSLPKELHSHIDLVAPTTYFGTLRSMKTTSVLEPETSGKNPTFASPASPLYCNAAVTPKCLQSMYKTIDYVPEAKSNVLGVAGYLNEFANYADLQVGQTISLLFADMNFFFLSIEIFQGIPLRCSWF